MTTNLQFPITMKLILSSLASLVVITLFFITNTEFSPSSFQPALDITIRISNSSIGTKVHSLESASCGLRQGIAVQFSRIWSWPRQLDVGVPEPPGTIFLDEDESWIRKIAEKFPSLDSYHVHVRYDTKTEWDIIMVDAPRRFHEEAPGRMSANYTAGVIARSRKKGETTAVFVHDVDRTVEDEFSMAFLCRDYMTEQQGRLRHFTVPSQPPEV
ncbi:hypothetical protein F2Q69_00020522 [Brassica cretica]|uniref:Polysaccharide biosynthesis domain-containing protein n=1 Tax=Brassica cretica TaxID=69181 RepID=A0A8S9Q795_BRACR|nr:hypothetical protein F2Q69_00020522 [Brassica cretica]